MRFRCGKPLHVRIDEHLKARTERWKRKKARLEDWHYWFAWRPVRLNTGECCWLEKVRRKGTFEEGYFCGDYWTWEYEPW